MNLKSVVCGALLASTFGAHAALVNYAPWDAAMAPTGLNGVQFNVNSGGGVTVALGAHAYKNGVLLANDGSSVYQANSGIYLPDGLGRANWSFDFAWDMTGCAGCTATLQADTDPGAGVTLVDLFTTNAPAAGMDSWNMEMGFINGLLGYNFNPFASSSTAFHLEVRSAAGAVLAASDITVNVPEPGSLALAGLALAGLAVARRRKA